MTTVGIFKESREARGVPRYIDDEAPDGNFFILDIVNNLKSFAGFFLDELSQFDNDVIIIKTEDPTNFLKDFRETFRGVFENRNIVADYPRYGTEKYLK